MKTPRLAYTLMEVVLVMAVLVMVTSLAYPFAAGWFSGQKTTSAADKVRAKLTEAKMLAQREGRAYQFSFKPNTGEWRMAPQGDEEGEWQNWATAEILGSDFRFAEAVMDGDGTTSADGTRNIIFLPNGTALTSERIGVTNSANQSQNPVVLQVRAETGSVTEAVEGHLP